MRSVRSSTLMWLVVAIAPLFPQEVAVAWAVLGSSSPESLPKYEKNPRRVSLSGWGAGPGTLFVGTALSIVACSSSLGTFLVGRILFAVASTSGLRPRLRGFDGLVGGAIGTATAEWYW